MGRRVICLLLALGLALSAAGCSSLLKGDYLVVQPHREAPVSFPGTDSPKEVSSAGALEAAILDLVLAGKSAGVIRLVDFATDQVEAMSSACWAVKTTSPYGAYAVDRISYEYTEILGYYDMEVHISYRRDPEQLESLLALSTPSQVRAALRGALRSSDSYLAISVSDSSIDEDFIRNYVSEYYYTSPQYVLALPQLELHSYPDSGARRILEIFADYPYSAEEAMARTIALTEGSQRLLNGILQGDQADLALDLCQALAEHCSPEPEQAEGATLNESAHTAYGAIVDGQADSEGYAMAFKLLCDMSDIECYVVLGRLDSASRAWNIIRLDGDYYHIDPLLCDTAGFDTAFLRSDGQMLGRYWWDPENYPACEGSLDYWSLTNQTPPADIPMPPLHESDEGAPSPDPEPSPEPEE